MSKLQIDGDGFQIVKPKNSRKNKPTKIPSKVNHYVKEEVEINIAKSLRRIETAVEELRSSEYYKQVIKSVSNISQVKNIVEIVCFGLGHVGECNISLYQLALLLSLKSHFKPNKVYVHDPIFYTDECKILDQCELIVIKENTEGNYIINELGTTLIYLPHCPKQLTNNFLWSNWGLNLENCILLCNSFNSIVENNPSRIVKDTVPFIHKILPLTVEVDLPNNFLYKDIFNDTSLHYFPKEKIESAESDFWLKHEKPEYENTEEFITTLMIEKLNL